MPLFRRAAAVVIGLLIGAILIGVIGTMSAKFFPPPPGVDASNAEAARAYLEHLPIGALLFVVSAWALGALGGSWVAVRLDAARSLLPGLIVGLALLLAAVNNMRLFPHPAWVWVAAFIVFPGGTAVGCLLARK